MLDQNVDPAESGKVAYPSVSIPPTIDPMNQPPHDINALDRLHRAGWSIGDVAFHDGAGGLNWLVWGSNGENLVRVEEGG